MIASHLAATWLLIATATRTSDGWVSFTTVQFGECRSLPGSGEYGELTLDVCAGDSYLRLVPRVGLVSHAEALSLPTIGADFVIPASDFFFSAAVDHAWGGMTRVGPAVTHRLGEESPFWLGLRTDAAFSKQGAGAVIAARVQLWSRSQFDERPLTNRLMFFLETGHAFVPAQSGARGFFAQVAIAYLIDNPF